MIREVRLSNDWSFPLLLLNTHLTSNWFCQNIYLSRAKKEGGLKKRHPTIKVLLIIIIQILYEDLCFWFFFGGVKWVKKGGHERWSMIKVIFLCFLTDNELIFSGHCRFECIKKDLLGRLSGKHARNVAPYKSIGVHKASNLAQVIRNVRS